MINMCNTNLLDNNKTLRAKDDDENENELMAVNAISEIGLGLAEIGDKLNEDALNKSLYFKITIIGCAVTLTAILALNRM